MSLESKVKRKGEQSNSKEFQFQSTDTNNFAIGLIPKVGSKNELSTALLRAVCAGYQPLVVNTDTIDEEAIAFTKAVGGQFVHVDVENIEMNYDGYRSVLQVAAQSEDFEHLIVHDQVQEPIDYERTERILAESDEFLVDAVPETAPETTASIVAAIPAYNEAKTITNVVEETSPHVDEVLVIDDGSEDATTTKADAAGATVIEHQTNGGYGKALKTAFQAADERDADHLVVLDGDGQHEPADIPKLVNKQQSTDTQIVIGSRLVAEGTTDIPLYRRCGLEVVNVLTNLSMGSLRPKQWVRDTQSGFRAYDETAIKSLAADEAVGEDMDASTDILYHGYQQGYDIEEVGTTVYYDVEDGSTQHPVSHGLRLVRNILNTIERDRPIAFLGVPGFLISVGGVTMGYVAMSNFLQTDTFPLGIALVSAVLFLSGLFLGLTAVVLHALKQYLEKGRGTVQFS